MNAKNTTTLQLATCIGCACTDEHACKGGCHWERVDYAAQLGVCSSCPELIAQWDAGERAMSTSAKRRLYNRKYYHDNKNMWRDEYNEARKAKRAALK